MKLAEKSKRTLPLPELLATVIRNYRKHQLADKLTAGKHWVETGLVFTTTKGTPFDGSTVLHRLQSILEEAKLPRYRFHDLRHSCASLLLSQGLPARTIMEILGHSQINLTLNTYAHVFPEMTRAAADVMDNLLASKLPNEKNSTK
ncbi:MAG: integrase family protein [bacterium]|nr:MAG: integrase family protein [bacterium]